MNLLNRITNQYSICTTNALHFSFFNLGSVDACLAWGEIGLGLGRLGSTGPGWNVELGVYSPIERRNGKEVNDTCTGGRVESTQLFQESRYGVKWEFCTQKEYRGLSGDLPSDMRTSKQRSKYWRKK